MLHIQSVVGLLWGDQTFVYHCPRLFFVSLMVARQVIPLCFRPFGHKIAAFSRFLGNFFRFHVWVLVQGHGLFIISIGLQSMDLSRTPFLISASGSKSRLEKIIFDFFLPLCDRM